MFSLLARGVSLHCDFANWPGMHNTAVLVIFADPYEQDNFDSVVVSMRKHKGKTCHVNIVFCELEWQHS